MIRYGESPQACMSPDAQSVMLELQKLYRHGAAETFALATLVRTLGWSELRITAALDELQRLGLMS